MKRVLSLIAALVLLLSVIPMQAFAEDVEEEFEYYYSVDLDAECNYDYAREILGYVNELRAERGLSALVLDKELTDCAMKRAVENAIDFSHYRPDSSSCFSICESGKMNAENIAIGRSSPDMTFDQWLNSPKHCAKMTNEIYRSIGIGAVYHNGHYFWVQTFSVTPTKEVETAKGIVPITHKVSVAENEVQLKLYIGNYPGSDQPMELELGKTAQFTVERFTLHYEYYTASISQSSFNWESSDPSVVSVDENGNITAVAPGTATVTATVKEGNVTLSQEFVVAGDLKNAVFSEIPPVVFFGEEVTPDPVIMLGDRRLEKDKDYTVTYSGNTEPGKASVKVTGIGMLAGETELEFDIIPADISNEEITVIEFPAEVEYTGEELAPEPVITVGGRQLVKDVDYTLEYSDNTEIGTASVIVTGQGIIEGSVQLSFDIKPVDLSDRVSIKVNGNAAYSDDYPDRQTFVEENVSVTYNKQRLILGEDYLITSTSLLDKKISSVTVEFIGQYSGKAEAATIAKAYVMPIPDQVYTGSDISPSVVVYRNEFAAELGEEPLTAGVDYYLSYSENVFPGQSEVIITGTGRYFGEVSQTFEIVRSKKCDVDRSGVVNMRDYALLQRWLNGWPVEIDIYAADINSDGSVNMKDLTLLQRYLNGWPLPFLTDQTAAA